MHRPSQPIQQYKALPRSGFLQRYNSSSLAHAFLRENGSLAHVGGDPQGLVAGEQLGGRAPSRLVLEIDVKRASGTVGLHNVDRSISKFLSIMLKVSAMRIPLAVTIISIAMRIQRKRHGIA